MHIQADCGSPFWYELDMLPVLLRAYSQTIRDSADPRESFYAAFHPKRASPKVRTNTYSSVQIDILDVHWTDRYQYRHSPVSPHPGIASLKYLLLVRPKDCSTA